jgi:hypothetical protein
MESTSIGRFGDQARRQDFIAWLTVVRRSRSIVLPFLSISLTTSNFLIEDVNESGVDRRRANAA